ncbi:MAG: endopeptidase La [Ruminococcus sp.]|jgi:ATP-dependent Lon protease|nr:endopeptidase La [Ruminococcus sp.]
MAETKIRQMPLIPASVITPTDKVYLTFNIKDNVLKQAVEFAMENDKLIFVTWRQSQADGRQFLSNIGIICKIAQYSQSGDGELRVSLEGKSRGLLVNIPSEQGFILAEVKALPAVSKRCDPIEIEAVMRAVKQKFGVISQFAVIGSQINDDIQAEADPSKLFDMITSRILIKPRDAQQMLEAADLVTKLALLLAVVGKEAEIIELQSHLIGKVNNSFDKSQRENFLREQLRAVKKELGEAPADTDVDYISKINALPTSEKSKEKLKKEAARLNMGGHPSENYTVINYLDTVLDLPWGKKTDEQSDIKKAAEILDTEHFGLEKVKERIIELLAVRVLKPDVKGQIICLSGPPGIGKTSVAKSLAKALGREYKRISLGGVRDEADIRGHRKTYIGAMPGRIIEALKSAGTSNPLILLDEIDKLGRDGKGDPSSALLEVLDSEQNENFTDHYIEIPFDLSEVLFVTTANNISQIDKPLLDRMEVIDLPSYTSTEKFHIASGHLVKKQLEQNGIKSSALKFTDGAVNLIIEGYTREAGVRSLERNIAKVCRKAAKLFVENERKRITVTEKNLPDFLGQKKFTDKDRSNQNEIGCVNGLAWTSVGGVIMPLECITMPGEGKLVLTGSLGDVMKESGQIALSYVRSVTEKYGIDVDFKKTVDIHIHAPEGATPKDGPSAGVTMVTALISALSGIPVRADTAMTGEITLSGKVLPIGGLREKLTAAFKADIKTVIIPRKNKPDLEEVADEVKGHLEIIFAETLTDVLDNALITEYRVQNTEYRNKMSEVRNQKVLVTI